MQNKTAGFLIGGATLTAMFPFSGVFLDLGSVITAVVAGLVIGHNKSKTHA